MSVCLSVRIFQSVSQRTDFLQIRFGVFKT